MASAPVLDNKIGSHPNLQDRTLENKSSERPQGAKKVQKMQNLLKKGKANLSRSKSELGDHNRKILQQLSRQRTEIGEQNKRLLASFRIKENQSLHIHT